jgi:hypothetical protein
MVDSKRSRNAAQNQQDEIAKALARTGSRRPRVALVDDIVVVEPAVLAIATPTVQAPVEEPATNVPAPTAPAALSDVTDSVIVNEEPLAVEMRALAGPFEDGADLVRKSVSLAPELLDALDQWRETSRDVYRRPNLSWLVAAAIRDLPTDIDKLRDLAREMPAYLSREEPRQLGLVMPRDVVEHFQDAASRLRSPRARGVKLWRVVSTLVVAQLEAEGVTLAPNSELASDSEAAE